MLGLSVNLNYYLFKCYRIQWSDMAYLTESIVVDKMYVSPKD